MQILKPPLPYISGRRGYMYFAPRFGKASFRGRLRAIGAGRRGPAGPRGVGAPLGATTPRRGKAGAQARGSRRGGAKATRKQRGVSARTRGCLAGEENCAGRRGNSRRQGIKGGQDTLALGFERDLTAAAAGEAHPSSPLPLPVKLVRPP